MSSTVRARSASVELPRPNKQARLLTPPEAIPVLADSSETTEDVMAKPVRCVRTYDNEIDYRDKLVLAPMVRTGSLPTRLLSLKYGAGLVWSPEVVDKAIIGCKRVVDPVTGVINYTKGQGPIFATHPIEKPYLIFQIGSSDPRLAVEAAKVVEQDVAGIDLNCGCPKPFSTHAGMGAALLSTPDILIGILDALLDSVDLPISCKIRLLPTQAETLLLAARILQTGIRNLTVHCRTRDMRPAERALWERLGEIVALGKQRDVPVICNGDGSGWENWTQIRQETGASSIMLARAAERNPSVFDRAGESCNVKVIVPQLLKIAKYIDNPWGNTKFLLSQFKPGAGIGKVEKKQIQEAIARSKSLDEVAAKLDVDLEGGEVFMTKLESILAQRTDTVFEEP